MQQINFSYGQFLIKEGEVPKLETLSQAMPNGWMWQIPLQNRWGCGYIFDDNYIDYEKTKQEVEEHLGHSIEKTSKFFFREMPCCKQKFCINCINTWFTESVKCPFCKQDIREIT